MRKRQRESCQAGIRKASESEPLMKRRKIRDGIKTGVCALLRDKPGGCPLVGQAVSGVKAARVWSAAAAWNLGKRVSILCDASVGAERERERVKQQKL
jgi:hypothetical protein